MNETGMEQLEDLEEKLSNVFNRRENSKAIENLTVAINNLNYILLADTESKREIAKARLLKNEY